MRFSDFAALVDDAVQQGDSFEQGMQVAPTAVLVSPHFLFRVEGQSKSPQAAGHSSARRLRAGLAAVVLPLEQHARRELFALAAKGKLHEDGVLEQQVRRLLD